MRTHLTLVCCALSLTYTAAQNSCSTAMTIAPGTYAVSAVDGPEAPSPLCINTGTATAAEWYRYTPTQDTTVIISTDYSGGTDTRFHVYTGACGALSCVVGDDDGGSGLTSVATFAAEAGVTYRIAFDDNWTSAGFVFSLTEVAPIVPAEGIVTFSADPFPALTGGDCVVDMNGDHLDDVVRASTTNVNIQYQLPGGGFEEANIPTTPADHGPSWSIVAGDIDGNGYNDLMYGGGQGTTFMMANDDGTAFTEVSGFPYIFCQRTNMVDINNDGALDAFSCHDVDANVRFMNDGNGNLTYIQHGLGETCGNYGSHWTDYDNDGDVDMFVSKCGCDPIDILMRNNGDGTFTNVAGALGLADGHQSWSSAWGDFDNDEDMDVLIGSSSSGIHKLMRNNGDGTFTNVTPGSGFDLHNGQSIEWATHDFNNDGYLDIIGGGRMMYGSGSLTFTPDLTAPSSGAVGDMNADGFLDIVGWGGANINDGNDNRWLKVITVGTVSNLNGIGARVTVTSSLGTQIRDVKSGDAFSTMSTLNTHFGLGQDLVADEVKVRWPSGIVTVINDVPTNGAITIVEGVNTEVNVADNADRVRIYPNPAQDQLWLELPKNGVVTHAQFLDATGKVVLSAAPIDGRFGISHLAPGVYMIRLIVNGSEHQHRFVKN